MSGARLVLPAIRAVDGSFAHADAAIEEALALGVGGFILFGGTRDAAATLTTRLQSSAGYPLLIAADLERGAGQQFRGLTQLPPPRALAHLHDPSAIREAGVLTAREARSVGVNWVFAPVADIDIEPRNPIVQTRAFGSEPAQVAAAVQEWVRGCQDAGALACIKHFPGHGRTVQDSHATLPTVTASRETLGADLIPFRAGIAAGVASVMTAHVAYPALDASGRPATRSPVIIGMLRDQLGFDGAVVTDALMMAGATAGTSEADAVCEVVEAGVDLLLYPKDIPGVVAALNVRADRSPEFAARLAASLRRREALLARINQVTPSIGAASGEAIAEGLARRLMAAGMLRGVSPSLHGPVELLLVDDDVDGDWPASPSTFVAEALTAAGVALGTGGSRVVLAFCEGRAGKGRGGFGSRRLEELHQYQDADLMVLFGHERLVHEVPGHAPVLGAWHRQALMQQAVARHIMERMA